MTTIGEYTTAGTIECFKIIAQETDFPSIGPTPNIEVDSIRFDTNSNKWEIFLDIGNNLEKKIN